MWKWIGVGLMALAIALLGLSLAQVGEGGEVSARALFIDVPGDISGYARAIEPYEWQFPTDYGAHPEFQTEWWYYTGNLANEEGRRFGYQFTIFRRAVAPEVEDGESEWRTNQVYFAHFTVSDMAGGQFYQDERFSRGAVGLAGATVEPSYHVWLEDWDIAAQNDEATLTTIRARTDEFAVDFSLEQIKRPALQGVNGLSQKGETPGNASYYYSLTRLLTEGTMTIGEETFAVQGTTWMDHEFSTSSLEAGAEGWDWMGLHLDDNREFMLGQIRLEAGGRDPAFGGLYVRPDGSTRRLDAEDFTIEATGEWRSPNTDTVYPAGWRVRVDVGEGEPLELILTPLLADQEVRGSTVYWEGAVRIEGDASGYGYVELTGYYADLRGRV